MKPTKIAIIGAGNLGMAIAQGLVSSGIIEKSDLILAERSQIRIQSLKTSQFNIINSNSEAIRSSELIIIAVKPQHMLELIEEIKGAIDPLKHILISCVTNISSDQIFTVLGFNMPLYKVMPNTGIGIQESMTCISSFYTNDNQDEEIDAIFSKLGQVMFIPENLMNAATVLAGCGIAFALKFIRVVMQGGIEIGFTPEMAKLIAAQITKGAADLILTTGKHPETEIDKVTTPGGITITGLNEMEHKGFTSAIIEGIITAYIKVNK